MKEIKASEIMSNPFNLIGDEWMLICAGNKDKYNMMTASWGGVGILWNKPVATVYIRPQRYTRELVDDNEKFTLCFFGDDKSMHKVCGNLSGRDVDKAELTGLVPVFHDDTVSFDSARMVVVCKKLYRQQMTPDCFIDSDVDKNNYPDKDHHFVYIGEIEKVLVRE